MQNLKWSLGIDAGEKSVGLAAVQYDENDYPISILSAISYIHDGGKDPASGKVPKSRKATAGVARRTRRLRARRRQRMIDLAKVLTENGFAVTNPDAPQTYDAWLARAALVKSKIDDEYERKRLISLAVMHMGHFRGWRNPWSSIGQLESLTIPSENFKKMCEGAALKLGVDTSSIRTIGELGALSGEFSLLPLRPRIKSSQAGSRSTRSKGSEELPKWIFFEQVRQEDILAELKLIAEVQGLDSDCYFAIRDILLHQERASVPKERVGEDPFDKSPRALRASLEYQEFRIRDKVANLRLATNAGKTPIPPDVTESIVQHLLECRDEAPTWVEIAESFGLPEETISMDGGLQGRAPLDMSSREIESAKNIDTIKQWWAIASFRDRTDFIAYIADPVEVECSEQIEHLLTTISEEEFVALENLSFQSGRSPYGRSTLSKLNDVMKDQGCDLYQARLIVFDKDSHWNPPKSSFQEMTGQPIVDRNIGIVRRFLLAAVEKWGIPEKVVIEHVREAFMGPDALNAFNKEQKHKRDINDMVREELKASGITNPERRDVLRKKLLQQQSCLCLYCGTAIDFESVELDHIVARAGGGSNRVSNLAAVCRRCNAEKGKLPFGRFCQLSTRPEVNLDDSVKRVQQWGRQEKQLDVKSFRNYQDDVVRRLRRISDDKELDERSLASTAYAAIEIRERIEQLFEDLSKGNTGKATVKVQVYAGRVTSLARRESHLGGIVKLRGETRKVRLDRRHHAIDAVMLTSLTSSVARVLVERDDMRQANKISSDSGYLPDQHFGREPGTQFLFKSWLKRSPQLATLVKQDIDGDRIAVMNPLRLRPEIGAMHEDTVRALVSKPLGAMFSSDEIRRVVDGRIYISLFDELDGRQALEVNADRSIVNEAKKIITSDDSIDLFPLSAAMLAVQSGSVELGSIHHVRIYAWYGRKNKITFGMIRVFGGEFGRIGFRKKGVDILSNALPKWSESWRLAEGRVVDNIEAGHAKQIGWLAAGDELDFVQAKKVPGSGDIRAFGLDYAECRWRIDGFPMKSQLRLRPLYLASEGLEESDGECVKKFVDGRGWWPAIDVVMNAEDLVVVRRTATGRPRWNSIALPVSWKPLEEAERRLS